MQYSTQTLLNYPSKNITVLKLFWVCTSLVTFMQILNLVYYFKHGFEDGLTFDIYISSYVILPTISMFILGIAASVICVKFRRISEFVKAAIILGSTVLLINIMIVSHYGDAVIFVCYIYPILLSLFYNSRSLTAIISVFSLLSYFIIILFYLPQIDPRMYYHGFLEISSTIAILLLTVYVGMKIHNIYSDLIQKIVVQTINKIELEREVKEDSLTKLFNHAFFYESLDFAILGLVENKTPLSIIVMDIDNFKLVNDTYGHAFGDIVILKLVEVIRLHISENDLAFRYGGEEFSVISFHSLDDTVAIAEKIREDFSKAKFQEHPEATLSISAGVSTFSSRFQGKRDFFTSADCALYHAKNNGKNQIGIADKTQLTTV